MNQVGNAGWQPLLCSEQSWSPASVDRTRRPPSFPSTSRIPWPIVAHDYAATRPQCDAEKEGMVNTHVYIIHPQWKGSAEVNSSTGVQVQASAQDNGSSRTPASRQAQRSLQRWQADPLTALRAVTLALTQPSWIFSSLRVRVHRETCC